jgi:hypothetical protein
MKLSDVMSAMGLQTYAQIALVICLAAFASVVVSTLLRRNRQPFDRARRLPLEPDDVTPGAPREAR